LSFSIKATDITPIKNKTLMADESISIVIGSVDGVNIAPAIADVITTILQLEIIFFEFIIPKPPRIN
tara:strand:+ start:395 stop:595 length:201 start_codon:yes stop_codon:yes gene_type:complete